MSDIRGLRLRESDAVAQHGKPGGEPMEHDYYRILGVDPSADLQTIKGAFRKKVMAHHPDRGGTHEEMVLVNAAWEILSNAETRRRYDLSRTQVDDAAAQAVARDDAEAARKRAEDYPKTWAETEVWLSGLSRDFARAWNQSTALGSMSGWIFIVTGALIGGCFICPFLVNLFLLKSDGSDSSRFLLFRIVCIVASVAVPLFCGGWAGATIHLAIAKTLATRRSVSDRTRIVACASCGQKLRIPVRSEELTVSCAGCKSQFSCPPAMPASKISQPMKAMIVDLGKCVGALFGLFVCGSIFNASGNRQSTPNSAVIKQPLSLSSTHRPQTPILPAGPSSNSVSRISVSGTEATRVLIGMVSKMSEADKKILAEEALRTGMDTYAVRVRIANTGNVAVTVVPENLRLHFRGVANLVWTIPEPGFLARSVIGSGEAVEGLVMYRETIENGANIRLSGGALIRYVDPNLQVEYP